MLGELKDESMGEKGVPASADGNRGSEDDKEGEIESWGLPKTEYKGDRPEK